MKNEIMYVRWQRNTAVVLLILTMIFCLMGWHKYKKTKIVKEGLENLLGNMYETIE